MHARKAILAAPLKIDVAKIATFYPEFRYRGPIPEDWRGKAITSEYILNDADPDKCRVLFFDDKTADGFTTITSDFSPRELAGLLTRLPTLLSSQLISALKGTALEIPMLSEYEYREVAELYESRQKHLQKLTSIQAPLKDARSVNFKSHEAVTVLQHEFAVTSVDSSQPILGTFGAGPCVILALYDEKNKKAVLAHIDAITNIYSLSMLLRELSLEHTVAHLAGGDFSSQDMCIDIVDFLQKNRIKIKNADLVSTSSFGDSASLAIDARTGTIYSPVEPYQLNQTPDIDMRLQIAGLQFLKSPLRQYYIKPNAPKSKTDTFQFTDAKHISAAHTSIIHNIRLSGLSDSAMPLGFLSSKRIRQNKSAEQQTYCGFKPGFLK